MPNLKNYSFAKLFLERVLSYSTHGAQGIAQTIRLSCKLIILSIGHFEGPTEVELNKFVKDCLPLINRGLIIQANFA